MAIADTTASLNFPSLGLFGGRFDPVHRAHLTMAQAAADQLGLPEVRWLVTGTPIHKPTAANSEHRLEMVRLALAQLQDPRMVADDREMFLSSKGHANPTWMTIESIQRDFPGRPLVWIMGEDQLQAFTTWRKWQWLLKNMTLAVCSRPGAVARNPTPPGARIARVDFEADTVSSTQVRASIAKGQPIDGLVPNVVADYLAAHAVFDQA